MDRKAHKYGAILRALTLSALLSVVVVQSCIRKKSSNSTNTTENQRTSIQYNENLSTVLAQAWQRDFVAVDDLSSLSIAELKDMTAIIQKMREMITDAQLESLDPALEQFFMEYGTEQPVIPHIAFQHILPEIPTDKPEVFTEQTKLFIQENIILFEVAFNTCKQWFEKQKKNS